MKLFVNKFIGVAVLVLAGCSPPQVNVKKEWTRSIASFSFIPLYPMREDVFVGDIRIHRLDANKGSGLYSRPLARLAGVSRDLAKREGYAPAYPESVNKPVATGDQIYWKQNVGKGEIYTPRNVSNRLRLMSLPGIDVTRINHADASASGLLGLWKTVIGTNFDSEETVFVSLTGLETVEIPDLEVAEAFRNEVVRLLGNDSALLGICAAAKSMGDAELKKTAISVVTRVAYARGAKFERKSDRRLGASVSADNSKSGGEDSAQGNANSQTTKALTLNEVFDRPLAFGVDAMMINPNKLYAQYYRATGKSLADVCEGMAGAFEASPVSPQLTGAPKRS